MLFGLRKNTHTPVSGSAVPSVAVTRFIRVLEGEGPTPVWIISATRLVKQQRIKDSGHWKYIRIVSIVLRKSLTRHRCICLLVVKEQCFSATGLKEGIKQVKLQRKIVCEPCSVVKQTNNNNNNNKQQCASVTPTWSPSSMKSSTTDSSRSSRLATRPNTYLCRASSLVRCCSRKAFARACTAIASLREFFCIARNIIVSSACNNKPSCSCRVLPPPVCLHSNHHLTN